jgi:hypothetical protein
MSRFAHTMLALALTAGSNFAGGAPATAAGGAKRQPDCFAALRHLSGTRVACEHQAWMTEQERADLKAATRGYLLDARCVVSVDVDRRLVEEALVASNRTWTAPPQPVTCALTTSSGPMTIGGTFAPAVVFKDGFAVDASPGLAGITGVNSYLAMPVVAYVNHAPGIRSEMAKMINAFRSQPVGQQAARR